MLRQTLTTEQKIVVDIATAAMLAKQELSKTKQPCCLCFWMKLSAGQQIEDLMHLDGVLQRLGVYQITLQNNVGNATSLKNMREGTENYVLKFMQGANLTDNINAAIRVVKTLQTQNLSAELRNFIAKVQEILPSEFNSETSSLLPKN